MQPFMYRFMPRPPMEILGTEIIYFLIIVTLCFVVYYKTRGLYTLSKHKGLYYFTNTFFYFALAYFFRLIHVLSRFSQELDLIRLSRLVNPLSLTLVSYFSTVAILSLVMAIAIRYVKLLEKVKPYFLHILALIASILVLVTWSQPILLLLQTIIIILSLIFLLVKSHKGFLS